MFSISIIGIVVAALVCFILGFLFHGPISGKLWIKLAGIQPTGNEKFSDMYGKMLWNFIVNVIAAFVLSVVINVISHSTVSSLQGIGAGIVASLLLWAIATVSTSINVIWMGGKKTLFVFETISSLICYIAMGIVLVLI